MRIASRIFLGLQVAAEALLIFGLLRAGMLTSGLWIPAAAIFAALLIITVALAFGGTGPKIASMALALIFSGVCLTGAVLALKAAGAVDAITATRSFSSAVGVYVKSDDSVSSVSDASSYTFAVGAFEEGDTVDRALDLMAQDLGHAPALYTCETPLEAVSALLDGTVRALVLEESYADLLSDLEDYKSFATDCKLIGEYTVTDSSPAQAEESPSPAKTGDLTKEPFLVYVSGSDTRTATLTKSRSDVNILMAVNPAKGTMTLINTPRDYYVPISVSPDGACDKLTHCGIYGIDCSMDTLADLYGVEVPYYVQLNFTGFKTLIDAIGGVDIESDTAFTTSPDAYYISEGINHMDGATALAFVRERHALAGGDNARGENQMKMMRAVVEKVRDAPTLLKNYSVILDSLSGMLATNLSSQQIASLVRMQLENGTKWEISSYAVSGTAGSSTTYSVPSAAAYVTFPDYSTVAEASAMLKAALEE